MFLTRELCAFAGERPGYGRAIAGLVKDGYLVRLGWCVYAKTRISVVSGLRIMAGPLPDVGREALVKLGVPLGATVFEAELREGRSTQVPTGRVVGVRRRVRRRLSYGGDTLLFERVR